MKVKIYTTSTCPYCDKTIEFLRSHNVEFTLINVDELSGREQEEAVAEAYRLSGQRRFPVTDIGGAGVIGFDIAKFKKLLGLKEKAGINQPVTTATDAEARAIESLGAEARLTGYILNPDEDLVRGFAAGLLKNSARYGYGFCPCRLATGDYNKDCDLICPCAYRDWDLDMYGRCYCGLYVTEEFVKSKADMLPIPDSREGLFITRTTSPERVEAVKRSPGPEMKEIYKVFSFTLPKGGRDSLRSEFHDIAGGLGMEKVAWHGETAEAVRRTEDGEVSLRFFQGMEGYVYILRFSSGDGADPDALRECSEAIKGRPNELYRLDLFIGEPARELIAGEAKGQKLRDGMVILSGYGYEPKERVKRYIVTPKAATDVPGVVDDIVRIETCYNLLLSQRQKYLLLSDQLGRVDERVTTKLGVINLNISMAGGDSLKGWLHCLSVNFGEVSGIAEELKRHAADVEGRRNVLNSILDRWEGDQIEGLQTISGSMEFYTRAVGDDYGRLIRRVEGIRREMGDMITILRTRVDIIQQEQSLDIQRSMHETARTQLRMQRAVESLEVFIVTYYMTVLARIVFEALEAQGRHLPGKPVILAGYLIPVFFLFAVFLSGKIWHIIETLRGRFREKRA